MANQAIGKRGARFTKKTPGQLIRNAARQAGQTPVQGADGSRVSGGRAPPPLETTPAEEERGGQQPEEVVPSEQQRPRGGRQQQRPIYVDPPTVIVAPAEGTGPETYEWMAGLLLFFTLIVIFFIGLSIGSRD